MKKCKIGDVFAIQTKKGWGIIQFVRATKDNGEVIRVLPVFLKKLDTFKEDILNNKEMYFIHFPLVYANKKKTIYYLGNYLMPEFVTVPTFFRSDILTKDNKINWHTVEESSCKYTFVENPSNDFYKLSDWAVWNDTLLRERLEIGWKLEEWR